MLKLNILVYFLMIQRLLAIESKELCRLRLKSSQCTGRYSIRCGDFCATNETTCDYFTNLNQITFFRMLLIPGLFHFQVSRYHRFLNEIDFCTNDLKEWSPSDVCINFSSDCFSTHVYPFGKDFIRVSRRVNCDCDDEFGYKCGKLYCARDRNLCEGFRLRMNSSNQTHHIKRCNFKKILKVF